MGTKYSQFPASSEINPSDVLVGLHNDGNSRFSFSTILVWIRQSVASFFVPTSRTVNNKALSQDISLGAEDVPYDNAHSSLTANNVQNAIDELAAGAGGGGVDPETIAPVEESATATVVHPLGSIFYFNDILYRAIEDIPVGGTINTATGGNATQTSIAQNFKRTVTLTSAEYAQLSIAEKTADIVYIITDDNSIRANDVNYDHETSGASATNVQDALDEVFSDLDGKQPTINANGILKGDGAGGVSAAVAGTDYASASAVTSLNNRYTDNTLWISNSDANDYKTSGMYAMATGNANIPAAWGILFVIAPRNDTIEQEYRCSGNIWNREFRSNTWSAWTQAVKQSQLAYMETGTTASRNYSAGQYISWNGLLYTADINIATGTTLSASGGNKNLTECVGGGFNSLSNVTNGNVTFSNNVTGYTYQNEYHLSKSGNVVTTSIYMSTSSIAGMGTVLCTVPAAFRPSVNRRIAAWLTYSGDSKVETVFISPSGEITTASGGSNVTGFIRVFGTYIL